MQPQWNTYRGQQPNNATQQMAGAGQTQNLEQRIANIENQLNMLIRMIEYNNQMLRHMYHSQNNINMSGGGSGGGSVIVRM
ncbi:hypothetical protein [Texcoconibacillus texcoconensis]|uniref:Uncharacterized protein n=1 Tax=Texcoconibacillus texcoconensis TaxID=1095777 RepID=A0A840QQK1_9BACI|nr:hypothetical protein [Texcoconibacillus texcoconensis]MBB5173654.1 hypothetical protein [Texcoconibacillus texcoconensis]